MMQGITTLPGAQQGNQQAPQAPGQAAQFQAMPAKQGGIAPPITAPLEKLPPQQLLSMYNNPQDTTPKWAVATAYAKAVEQARLMQMAQGQSAMAQGQAQAQQPPVAQQVMMQPVPQETQFARHGGIMHGYAGGGAVAFQSGGGIADPFSMTPEEVKKLAQRMLREQQLRETFSRLPPTSPTAPTATPSASAAPTYGMRALGTLRAAMGLPAAGIATVGGGLSYGAAQQLANMDRETREQFIGMPDDMSFAAAILNATPPKQEEEKVAPTPTKPEVDSAVAEIMERNYKPRRYPSSTTSPTQSAGPARPSGPVRQSNPAAAPAGIASVANQVTLPPLDPYYEQQAKEAEELARSKAEMIKAQGIVSPEVLASRQRLRQAQESAYEPQRKALEEAKAERDAGLFGNAEALGRMAAAVGGTKRFGQGLAAAAGAGSEVVARQRERIEKLSDRYNDLQAQLNLTMAQAQHADVVGDDALKRKALADAEAIKMELFNTRNALHSAAYGQRAQEVQGIAALRKAAADEMAARAHMISAGKPTDFQQKLALYRADPNTYESMFGSKDAQLMTRVQQVTNTDPLLKQLASNAAMNLPGATEQYNARYRELISMHAPELLIGTAPAAGGGARAAATDVVRKGQQ